MNDEMNKINKYISKQNLENCEFYGLVRNFNIINNEHSFSYGGRIQSVGNNNFQTLKKEQIDAHYNHQQRHCDAQHKQNIHVLLL